MTMLKFKFLVAWTQLTLCGLTIECLSVNLIPFSYSQKLLKIYSKTGLVNIYATRSFPLLKYYCSCLSDLPPFSFSWGRVCVAQASLELTEIRLTLECVNPTMLNSSTFGWVILAIQVGNPRYLVVHWTLRADKTCFIYLFFSGDRVVLCSLGWPKIYSNPLDLVFRVLDQSKCLNQPS